MKKFVNTPLVQSGHFTRICETFQHIDTVKWHFILADSKYAGKQNSAYFYKTKDFFAVISSCGKKCDSKYLIY